MAGIRLVLLLGISLAHNALVVQGGFLKAALGLRIGLSPEEKGWGQPYQHHGGPAVKGQFLSGVQKPGGHGGWGGGGGGGGHGGGGGSFLKHLKILGVNLYLGGPKHHHAGGGGGGGHQGGSHYSKGGWGWGQQSGYSSHPQFNPSKQTGGGGMDYSTNEITVIGGDNKAPQSHYGYATSLVAGQVFGNPGPNHPFANNQQGKSTQNHVVYVPAASQYPSHYANEVVNEIKFLNGKSHSPAMTGPRPPTLNGGQGGRPSYAPSQGGSHYNGALRGGGPPPQGFSLASLMKGPQWAPKQQPRGMARFLPFFGMRGSGGPPPPPGHPMHSPYRRPGPPQRQQKPNGGQEVPSFSTLYNVKALNNGQQQQQLVAQGTGFHPQQQQQQSRGFSGQGGNNHNGDYRPHAFGGFVESSNAIGPAGPGGIPFVPRQVQHGSHPSSPTYLQQQSNHPRSHFNQQNSQRNPGFSQQGPPPSFSQQGPPPSFSQQGPPPSFSTGGPPNFSGERPSGPGGPPPSFSSGGPGGPPNFNSGRPSGPGGPPPNFSSGGPPQSFSSGAPGTVVHNFPPQHTPHHSQGPNGLGYHNSQESFSPPAFSPILTNSAEHGGPSSSSSSSLLPFGNSEHHGFPESSPSHQGGGPGFISLASTSAGPVGSNPNYPYISPLGPFASEKQRQFVSQKTQFASGSGSSQNAVEFSPSPNAEGPVEFSPGHAQVQVYHEQNMGGYEPLPGFAYSHSDTSDVVSMGMTTKNDPPVMMESNSIPPEFKSSSERASSSSAESSSPSQQKRRFATSQEQQQEIRLQKRQQGASSTQIQSPVTSSGRKVRGGFLNSNMVTVASSSQVWNPIEQSSKTNKKAERPNRSVENKKMQSRSSSGEQSPVVGDMATSPTEVSTATLKSSKEQVSSRHSKVPFIRKRMTTSTTTTSSTSINTDKPTTTTTASSSSAPSTASA